MLTTRDPKTLHPVWRSYRRWWMVTFISFGVLWFWVALMREAAPPLQAIMRLVAFALVAVTLVGFIRLGLFRCPNCGKPFHSRSFGSIVYNNPFNRRCLNCGFERGEDPPPQRSLMRQ